ncbi:MAG TPA: murein L,D-transpeptidase catalytic domain family protein [Thermoanaerobaculia bacterium]|nr:murein L,D-transpeptidase catalytic domain family protein [Thermoanaerobaculia bacterium]
MKKISAAMAFALMMIVVAPEGRAAGIPAADANVPESLLSTLVRQAPGLRLDVLRLAFTAALSAENRGLVKRRDLLTVIDYSLPSTEPRLFVFDLNAGKLLFRELVAHGRNSGDNQASFFSNNPGSLATSLGLFVTAEPYIGGNGYSLRLRGLESGVNDQAWDRLIVMHGASYVSNAAVKAMGRLGRSWGCPAIRQEIAHQMIDTLRGGSPVFAYYPEKSWLSKSSFVQTRYLSALFGSPAAEQTAAK